jgi:hypothetical protein
VDIVHNPNEPKDEEIKVSNADEDQMQKQEKDKKKPSKKKIEVDERGIPTLNKVEVSYPPEAPGEYKKVPNRR